MMWRLAVYTAAAGFCLLSQISRAQEADAGSSPSSEAPAAEASEPSPASKFEQAKDKFEATAAAVKGKAEGVLGKFRVGPHVAVGIPHPLTAGIDLVYDDIVSLSVAGGRTNTKVEDVEVEIRNWDVALRWFPFQGSFFLGAAYGNQGIVGKASQDVEIDYNGIPLVVPTTFRLEVESKYLTPQLGWFARWDSGFTLGFELGLQMPSGSTSELQTAFENLSTQAEQVIRENEDYKKTKDDVEDAGRLLGEKAIPYINLIKLGWLF